MNLLKTNKSRDFLKCLSHFENFGFLKYVDQRKAMKLCFGPPGELLLHNIKQEWIYNTITYREMNVFPFSFNCWSPLIDNEHPIHEIKDGFSFVKTVHGDTLPFGITFSRSVESMDNGPHVELKQVVFEKPLVSKQFFYRHLQQRKRWWRKFSVDPGKVSFGEVIKTSESSVAEEAQILYTSPWGSHELESVQYLGSEPFQNLPFEEQNNFVVMSDKKRCLPHIIESTTNVNFGALIYLLDAFDENTSGRPVLRFHRKLAPFKYGFASGVVSSNVAQELFEMSRMICLDLKKRGLSCLFPSIVEFGKKPLAFQLEKHDALGICYTIVLNEPTLKSGICGLYNRETTLQEQTHISKIPDYCDLIMKNY